MKIIDLTLPCHNDMLRFPNPWIAPYSLQPAATHETVHRSVMNVTFCTHTGTHVDAPFHFDPTGRTVDEIPLHRLYGPARLIDLTDKGPLAEITREDLKGRAGGSLTDRIVVLYTRWYDYWPHEGYYQNAPFVGMDAAEWLIDQGIRSLAIDLPTIDDARLIGPDKPLPVHVRVLGADIPIIECLTNLHLLQGEEFILSALPLKLVGSDGSPARVVGIVA